MRCEPATREAVLGLGGNVDGLGPLQDAAAHCQRLPGTSLLAASALYATAPWGGASGGGYLNAALLVETRLDPWDLVAESLCIERSLGRIRGPLYGPRRIDIDLLWQAGARLCLPAVTVPHPALLRRRFALAPLCDVKPDAVVAPGLTARRALSLCQDPTRIQRLDGAWAHGVDAPAAL